MDSAFSINTWVSQGRDRSKSEAEINHIRKSSHYANEFENDESSRGSHSHTSLLDNVDDTYDKLQSIDEFKLKKAISNKNTIILFDSLMKVYSGKLQSYIDIAAILTKRNLYFVSANNYQIWQQLKDRTKIEELMDNDTKIEENDAIQLCENLNITDDENAFASKLLPFFRGKTKRKIKLDILLREQSIKSVAALFGLNDTNHYEEHNKSTFDTDDVLRRSLKKKQKKKSKEIKIRNIISIIIKNINVIESEYIDDFMIFIFDGIPWINQEKTPYHAKIITLQRYYSKSIIAILNDQKQRFCNINKIEHANAITICPYKINQITDRYKQCKVVDLKRFKNISPLDLDEMPYCFKLNNVTNKSTDIDIDKHEITCQLPSNNTRFEWITHIDYALKNSKYLDGNYDEKKDEDDDHIDIYMDDYTTTTDHVEDNGKEGEFSHNFNFGVYLNYWESGYDNSVIPRWPTLRWELVKNKYETITRTQYYLLYEQCIQLYIDHKTKRKVQALKAQDIGVNNKKFNIPKGAPITINHLVALKVYCNYTTLQRKFKQNCRKQRKDELLQDLIKRNREIAHWCRYIKECCTFYGKVMKRNKVIYTGLKNKLVFNSLKQNFECPLSTSFDVSIGNKFADCNGIMLQMQRANIKTRYFDVSWLSDYPEEKEALFMGSSLKIIDIYMRMKSSKYYVSAIQMFGKIIDGQFIDRNDKVEDKLYCLIQAAINSDDKAYETPSTYFMALFMSMIQIMKRQYTLGAIWKNMHEINKIKHEKLKYLLNGTFFDHFGVDMSKVYSVRQYLWVIDNNEYTEFMNKKPRQYIESGSKKYIRSKHDPDTGTIKFHFETCAKHSDEAQNCSFFLYLDRLPSDVEEIRVSFDLSCILLDESRKKHRKYSHLMVPQWLSMKKKKYCGFQVFPSQDLTKYASVSWKIGLKIVDTSYKITGSSFNRDNIDYNMNNIADAINNNDNHNLVQMFRSLSKQIQQLKSQNMQKDEKIKKLKQEIALMTQAVNYAAPTPQYHHMQSPSFASMSSAPFMGHREALSGSDIQEPHKLNEFNDELPKSSHSERVRSNTETRFFNKKTTKHNKIGTMDGIGGRNMKNKKKKKNQEENNHKSSKTKKMKMLSVDQSTTSESGEWILGKRSKSSHT